MYEVWRTLELRPHRVEQLTIMKHEVSMRQVREVTGKYGMEALMLVLNNTGVNVEATLVHINPCQNTVKRHKYKWDELTLYIPLTILPLDTIYSSPTFG